MLKLRRTTLQSRHMNVVAPQITANMIASLTFCSGEKRTKYQISASLLSFAHAISPIGGGFHSQWARNVKNPIFCATLFFLTRWPWKHNKSTVCFSTAKLNYLTCLSFFHHVSYLLRILCYINLPKFAADDWCFTDQFGIFKVNSRHYLYYFIYCIYICMHICMFASTLGHWPDAGSVVSQRKRFDGNYTSPPGKMEIADIEHNNTSFLLPSMHFMCNHRY